MYTSRNLAVPGLVMMRAAVSSFNTRQLRNKTVFYLIRPVPLKVKSAGARTK
jgi:hypothetical protein